LLFDVFAVARDVLLVLELCDLQVGGQADL
jgi:hypothetical protein